MTTIPIKDLEEKISDAIGPNNQKVLDEILTNLKEISREIYTNQVTGAPGIKKLEADIQLMRTNKEDQDIYVVMLDIDDFGAFNKNYGEETGNEVLKGVTRIIGETLREDDVVLRVSKESADYHLHGEEMLALYVCQNLDDAVNVSERIVSQIADRTETEIGYRVTVSAGVTKFEAKREYFEDAKARADRYMQVAKKEGKNQTYTADELRDPLFIMKEIFYRDGKIDDLARRVPETVKLAKGVIGRTATELVNKGMDYLREKLKNLD
jgi:diguanylate cyclase (GGDEF)-like protein